MQANYFNRLSLGTFFQGQGTNSAVEQAAEAAVRARSPPDWRANSRADSLCGTASGMRSP